jgi:hypothetical protein
MQTKMYSNPSVSHVEEDAITFGEQLQHPAAATHPYHEKKTPSVIVLNYHKTTHVNFLGSQLFSPGRNK